jgi:hypothetical protein
MDTHGIVKFSGNSTNSEEYGFNDTESNLLLLEFYENVKDSMEMWLSKLDKKNDAVVMQAIIKIFEDAEKLDNLDKKGIFFILKELTGLKPQAINGSLKNIRKLYRKFKDEYGVSYDDNGKITSLLQKEEDEDGQ